MPVSRSNISRFALSVADKRTFGRVFTQLLQMVLIIVHRPLRVLIFHDGVHGEQGAELTNVKSFGLSKPDMRATSGTDHLLQMSVPFPWRTITTRFDPQPVQ